jgi:hypothetical protein
MGFTAAGLNPEYEKTSILFFIPDSAFYPWPYFLCKKSGLSQQWQKRWRRKIAIW